MTRSIFDQLSPQPESLAVYLLARSLEIAERALAEVDPLVKDSLKQLSVAHWRSAQRLIERQGSARLRRAAPATHLR